MKRRKPPSQRRQPLDLPDCIRMVTKMQVCMARKMSDDPDDKIRADIKAAFNEAIAGDKTYRMPVQFKDGHVEPCLTMAGAFRTVFKIHGLDRKDPWQQERWWSIVEEAMNWALAQTDGDYRRKTA